MQAPVAGHRFLNQDVFIIRKPFLSREISRNPVLVIHNYRTGPKRPLWHRARVFQAVLFNPQQAPFKFALGTHATET
jgi:hypothetical protein